MNICASPPWDVTREIAEGRLFAWGKGDRGQLGLGDNEAYKRPVQLRGRNDELRHVKFCDVDAGFSHSAAVSGEVWKQYHYTHCDCLGSEDGRAWIWGKYQSTELASSRHSPADEWYPRQLNLPTTAPAIAVSCGQAHTTFLTADGRVWMTGVRGRGILYDQSQLQIQSFVPPGRRSFFNRHVLLGGPGALQTQSSTVVDTAGASLTSWKRPAVNELFQVDPLEVDMSALDGRIIRFLRSDLHHSYAITGLLSFSAH